MEEMTIIYLILFAVFLGLAFIPAKLASSKGYSFGLFYLFGVFFWLPALIVALVIQGKNTSQAKTIRATEGVDLLLKYKQLLDSEVITQAEFDVKKRELLAANAADSSDGQASVPRPPFNAAVDRTRIIWILALCAAIAGLLELLPCFLFGGAGFVKMLTAPPHLWMYGYPVSPTFYIADLFATFAGAFFVAFHMKKHRWLSYAGIAACSLAAIFLVISFIVTMGEMVDVGFVDYFAVFLDYLLVRALFSIPALIACAMGVFVVFDMRESRTSPQSAENPVDAS